MRLFAIAGALWLAAASPAGAQQPDYAEQEAAALPRRAAAAPEPMGKDKTAIEAYLKRRIEGIQNAYRARLNVEAKDSEEWTKFWTKVRDDRKLFEVRIARQRLDLFESLASLEPKERPTAISDFEKLQANFIKAFENQQRTKMADFFAARERRWKDYYEAQERERAGAAADIEASWQRLKGALRPGETSRADTEHRPDTDLEKILGR